MKKTLLALGLLATSSTFAHTPITLMATSQQHAAIPIDKVSSLVKQYVYADDYRQVKVQVIFEQHKPSHLLIYTFSSKQHRVQVARLNINANYEATDTLQQH